MLIKHSPVLRKKIEAGLRDIRAGRTMALSDYVKQRAKRKARSE